MERSIRKLFQFQHYLRTKNQSFTTRCKIAYLGTSSSTRDTTAYCWKCGAEKSSYKVFCEKCNTIQTPEQTSNYFQMLGIEEQICVDPKKLKEIYRQFQRVVHPDKFSNRSPQEQTISEKHSSLVNKAFNTLMLLEKRAEHLLEVRGEKIDESDSSCDPSFLVHIMNLNEEVDDVGASISKLLLLKEKNESEIKKVAVEVDLCFKRSDIKAAKDNVIKLKYLVSIKNRINQIFREKGYTD